MERKEREAILGEWGVREQLAEDGEAATLERAWRDHAAACGGDAGAFTRRWRRGAERWSFAQVNDLIERHNRWYPAESRLPMDVRSGDFALVNGKPYRRTPLDAAWVLERFPPVLALVREAA